MWGLRARRLRWPAIVTAARRLLARIRRRAGPVCAGLRARPSYREYSRVDIAARDSGLEEEDPGRLLDHWLGELNSLGQGLDPAKPRGPPTSQAPRPILRPQDPEGGARQRRAEYRCSIINMDNSQDEELDAILGELTMLQGEFETEIREDRERTLRKKNSISPSPIFSQSSSSSRSPDKIPEGSGARSPGSKERTKSPETDSAFGDNLSVLSSSSACSSNSGQLATGEEEDRIISDKIKLALEKIKEASIKKMFIKVFTSDGSAKSLLVDEKMTVGQVTRILAEKNNMTLDPKWALVELVPDLYMERVYEDNELLVENCLLWKVDSKNTLWFIERPEKFDLFSRPEIYLLGSSSSQKDDQMEEHSRQELLEEYFSSSGVGAPQIEGFIWLKADSKKSWKKFYFVLRTSGLYYAPKGKKTSRDLVCLTTFDVNQVYYGVGWKGKYKAPTEYCFGIKHPQIQTKNPKYIKYLCVDTQKELHEWVTGIRIAKNGRHLFDNYRGIVEEITHADIDILTSKRFSINSTTGLKSLTSPVEKAGEAPSQALTPSSENKSLASALSSGIESDMSQSSSKDGVTMEVEAVVERAAVGALIGPLDRGFNLRRSFSRSPQSSTTSGSSSEKAGSNGFESDYPAGGTIRKRPAVPFPPTSWGLPGLQGEQAEEVLPPPPPRSPSVTSLDSVDMLPPPPPPEIIYGRLAVNTLSHPKPFHATMASLPPRPPTLKKSNSVQKPSSRKISFDDNVQIMEAHPAPPAIPKYEPAAPIRNENPRKLTWSPQEAGDTGSLPRSFLDSLQKVMSKKWQVAEKCQANTDMTPHKVLGFRTDEPVSQVGQPNLYSKNSAIGAWVLETQLYAHEPQYYGQESPPQSQRQQQWAHIQTHQLLQQLQQQQQLHEQHQIYLQKHDQHNRSPALYGHMFQQQLEQHQQQQQYEYEQQQYGHNGVYGEYSEYAAMELESPYVPRAGQPVVLREPEPTYVDPGRMRENKARRPPPPPRRSHDTHLSNHAI